MEDLTKRLGNEKNLVIEKVPLFTLGGPLQSGVLIRYILALVEDKNGNSKLVARAADVSSHSKIFNALRRQVFKEFEVEPSAQGGGFLVFNEPEKSIKVMGDSESYGKADSQKIYEILASAYPGWRIEVKN